MTSEKLLSIKEVAERVGFKPGAVRGMVAKGLIKGRKVQGEWKVLESDLILFMTGKAPESTEVNVGSVEHQERMAELKATIAIKGKEKELKDLEFGLEYMCSVAEQAKQNLVDAQTNEEYRVEVDKEARKIARQGEIYKANDAALRVYWNKLVFRMEALGMEEVTELLEKAETDINARIDKANDIIEQQAKIIADAEEKATGIIASAKEKAKK